MSEAKACPHCGKPAPELLRLDADMRGRLSSDLGIRNVPESVCASCYASFGNQLSSAANKRSKRIAKEQHRLNLWRSRVHLIREARERFAIKDFPGAVVNYEKYFRVLEIIYEVKPNEIKAAHFNNSARSKELVVIASAYWDLMRIYDQSKRFIKRLEQCADKLGEFLPYTPMYAEIIRKIDDYRKVAKNKEAFDKVVKIAGKNRKRCFIATAAFESPSAPTVELLTKYRDEVLERDLLGRAFARLYYFSSPPVAKVLDQSEILRKITRKALVRLAQKLDEKYSLKSR